MLSYRQWENAVQRGLRAAADLHAKLDLDLSERVDVFKIIEDTDIWLMFQPLKGLYGLYQRGLTLRSTGILINSNHPLSLQRFTAAHELGHHTLGHTASIDSDLEIMARTAQYEQIQETDVDRNIKSRLIAERVRELEAQSFAANFLMPVELLNRVVRSYGLSRVQAEPTPVQVYQMALQMGSSFQATVQQLLAARIISTGMANNLRSVQPAAIKIELLGQQPQNMRNDVWCLYASDSGRPIRPRRQDEIVLRLPENPSTGYIWDVTEAELAEGGILLLLGAQHQESETGRVGGKGIRKVLLQVTQEGQQDIHVKKRRPWLPDRVIEEFDLNIKVIPSATGEGQIGLYVTQQEEFARL